THTHKLTDTHAFTAPQIYPTADRKSDVELSPHSLTYTHTCTHTHIHAHTHAPTHTVFCRVSVCVCWPVYVCVLSSVCVMGSLPGTFFPTLSGRFGQNKYVLWVCGWGCVLGCLCVCVCVFCCVCVCSFACDSPRTLPLETCFFSQS